MIKKHFNAEYAWCPLGSSERKALLRGKLFESKSSLLPSKQIQIKTYEYMP